MRGVTLDAGALIAFERGKRSMVTLVARAREQNQGLAVPAGVIAQVWRDGKRQARLIRLLSADLIEIVPLNDRTARAVGQLLGTARTKDVVDGSVVLCARERDHVIVTSDPDDLRRIDPRLSLVAV
jgi:hypothetical protein